MLGTCVSGRCACVVLNGGARCRQAVVPPQELLPKLLRRLRPFHGNYVLSRGSVGEGTPHETAVLLTLPGGGPKALGTVDTALLRNLPTDDLFARRVHATCAIVGSSGSLLSYENGGEIDDHDLVMRFNDAPTQGFELYVGGKTTHRLCSLQQCNFREFQSEKIVQRVNSPAAFKAFLSEHRIHRKNVGDLGRPMHLYAMHPDLQEYVSHVLPFRASTGLLGVLVAMHSCTQVDLYGYAMSNAHGFSHRYYSRKEPKKDADERDEAEWQVLKAFDRLGLVRIVEPCVHVCHKSLADCVECTNADGR